MDPCDAELDGCVVLESGVFFITANAFFIFGFLLFHLHSCCLPIGGGMVHSHIHDCRSMQPHACALAHGGLAARIERRGTAAYRGEVAAR